jgi:CHAT domain-containing protein
MPIKIFIIFRGIQSFFQFIIVTLHRIYYQKLFIKSLIIFLTTLFIILEFNSSLLAIDVNNKKNQIAQIQTDAKKLLEQGRKLYDDGKYSEAINILQQAAAIFKSQDNKLEQSLTLTNISVSFKQLGQLEQANKFIVESLQILQTAKNQDAKWYQLIAQSLDIQGELQLRLGKPDAALLSWKQAQITYKIVGNEIGKIRSLINQSIAQQKLGFYRQSKTTLEEIYPQLEKQPDSLMKATALRSFGDILQLVGDLDKSRQILLQSINISKKLQFPVENAEALLSLGNNDHAFAYRMQTEAHQEDFAKITPLSCKKPQLHNKISNESLIYYQQALKSYAEAATISNPTTQIQAKLNQLNIFLELQKWSEVQRILPDLKLQLPLIPPSQSAIYANINFAQSLSCIKQANSADFITWKEIAQIVASAIQQAKSIGDNRTFAYALGVLGELYLETGDIFNAQKLTEQALTRSQSIGAIDITYQWQWQLGYIFSQKGNIKKATILYTEAVDTLKSLRSDLIALNPYIQFSFRDNVEPVYRQLVDLLLRPETPQSSISQNKLAKARDVIEALQLTELENFFREACLLPKPRQIDEVVDKTDITAAVIYPIILKDRLEIILKLPTQNELRHYTTRKSQTEVEKNLEQLQQSLREIDQINKVNELSSQLYSWLIQPTEAELEKHKIKTLVFVLDGSLRNIPMSVLYNQQQKKYLLEKYAISIAPGMQLIDPKPLQRSKIHALIAGVSEQRNIEGKNFSPLENIKVELKQIRTQIPNSIELLNQYFTKNNLQSQMKSTTFSVVHIATHGEFSSNSEKTFILTWERLLKVKDFDTLLRLGNQREPENVIELLVLSACQTATGDKRAALGLAGVAVRAGARSTLATLWSIDDESTAELMAKFYHELENATVTKAEALRRAQLVVLTSYENPYFWAPYVLVGNWL